MWQAGTICSTKKETLYIPGLLNIQKTWLYENMKVRRDIKKLNIEWSFNFVIISEVEGSELTHILTIPSTLNSALGCQKILQMEMGSGSKFAKTDTQLRKCAGSTLPLLLTAVSFQRENIQLWSFNLAHNHWFCKFLMSRCCASSSPSEDQWSGPKNILHVLNFFLQKYLVPLKLILCSERWKTSGFNAISGKMQYFTYNFLQYMVLSYFPWSMILGLPQKGLECSTT